MLLSLPPEILLLIIPHLKESDLRALALCSRTLLPISQSQLYRAIVITGECSPHQCQTLIECIEQNPQLLGYSRKVDFTASVLDHEDDRGTRASVLGVLARHAPNGGEIRDVAFSWIPGWRADSDDDVDDDESSVWEILSQEVLMLDDADELMEGLVGLLRAYSISITHLEFGFLDFPIEMLLLCPNLECLNLRGCSLARPSVTVYENPITLGLPKLSCNINLSYLKCLAVDKVQPAESSCPDALTQLIEGILPLAPALSSVKIKEICQMPQAVARLARFSYNTQNPLPCRFLSIQAWLHDGPRSRCVPSAEDVYTVCILKGSIETLELRYSMSRWDDLEGTRFQQIGRNDGEDWGTMASSLSTMILVGGVSPISSFYGGQQSEIELKSLCIVVDRHSQTREQDEERSEYEMELDSKAEVVAKLMFDKIRRHFSLLEGRGIKVEFGLE